MPSSPGDFGGPKGPAQCTAKSKRSGERCKGVAVSGSRTQKCRMHGGHAAGGTEASNFIHGRHSRYLPADLSEVYEESLTNPDLLDMSEHIALLEARINDVLRGLSEDGVVPRWGMIEEVFGEFETALLSGDMDKVGPALQKWHAFLEGGKKWDRAWETINDTLEQLRKVAEVEVKRKRDLHQMIPVQRVMTLMASVAAAVKRNVKDPTEIEAVYREMELMYSTNRSLDGKLSGRAPNKVIDVAST